MSDWQIGDLAVCVDAKPRKYTAQRGPLMRLREGASYRVVGMRPAPHSGELNLFLEGLAYPDRLGHRADRFRKIRPDEHQSREPEFVTLLNRIKRKVTA